MKFNLNTYLGMVKEAMAGKARRYRDHTDYTPLDNAIKGDSIAVRYGDESQTWAQLCEEIPSVQGVLNEALDFREEKRLKFIQRYGDGVEDIDSYFQVFVGFNPMYGMYVLSAGPYTATTAAWRNMLKYARAKGFQEITDESLAMAENDPNILSALEPTKEKNPETVMNMAKQVKADRLNRFASFVQKFARVNPEQIEGAAKKYYKKLTSGITKLMPLSNINDDFFDKSDLQIDVKVANGKIRGKEGGQLARASENYGSVDPNTPQGQQLYSTEEGQESLIGGKSPVLGKGSELTLNAKGVNKIMSIAKKTGDFEGAFNLVKQEAMRMYGITEDQLEAHMNSNLDFWAVMNKILKGFQKQQVYKDDPSFNLMRSVMDWSFHANNRILVGSQGFEALRTKESQVHLAEFTTEVLETYLELGKTPTFKKHNNKQKAQEVASAMQAKRDNDPRYAKGKAQGTINPEVIANIIERLKREKNIIGKKGFVVGTKNYAMLLEEARNYEKQIKESRGTKSAEGFSDFESCKRATDIYMSDPRTTALDEATGAEVVDSGETFDAATKMVNVVDPLTKAKLYVPKTSIFKSSPVNVTVAMLSEKRQGKLAGVTDDQFIATDEKAEVQKLSPLEIREKLRTHENELVTVEQQEQVADTLAEQEPETDEDFADTPEKTEINEQGVEVPVEQGEEFPVEEVGGEVAENAQAPEDFPIEEVPAQGVEQQVGQVQPQPQVEPVQQAPLAQPEQVQPVQEEVANEAPLGQQNPVPAVPKKQKRKKAITPVNNLVANTLSSLIKIAKELDDKGKCVASEEIHRIIRKYQERI
jgi:hypothetical protein